MLLSRSIAQFCRCSPNTNVVVEVLGLSVEFLSRSGWRREGATKLSAPDIVDVELRLGACSIGLQFDACSKELCFDAYSNELRLGVYSADWRLGVEDDSVTFLQAREKER